MENRGMTVFMVLALVALAQISSAESGQSNTNNAPVETLKSTINLQEKPIEIKLYYESLCKDTIDFVGKQFTPVYDKLNKFINVTFIPFSQGNITTTNTTDTPQIHCRRDGECDADIIHACGIDKIHDQDKLVKFVNCSLVEAYKNNKTIPLETCVKNSGIDDDLFKSIKKCSDEKDEYIKLLQNDLKMAKDAEVTTVPKIVLNKNSSKEIQDLSVSNFMKAVCDQIPEKDKPTECKNSDSGSNTIIGGILPILAGLYFFINIF